MKNSNSAVAFWAISRTEDNSFITLFSEGTTTITAKYKLYKATCKINVKNSQGGGANSNNTISNNNIDKSGEIRKEVPSTGTAIIANNIKLNYSSINLNVGSTKRLSASFSPENVSNKTINWTSSDSKIATVDISGLVTANKVGTATITAFNRSSGKKATCTVTVKQPIKSISLSDTSKTLNIDGSYTLTVKYNPSNASYQKVTWSSSKPNVVSVDKNTGKLTAKKIGTATITAKAADGSNKTAKCSVTVKRLVKSISLNRKDLSIKVGNSFDRLKATVNPSNASNPNTSWSSSNSKVATVDRGKVTTKKVGTATITATAQDGSKKKATCTVNVWQPVTWIKMSKTSITLNKGKTFTLTATAYPTYAKYRDISWSSSNPSVATVNSKGKITAIKKGSATIKAKTKDGYSKTCKVKVTQPVEYITISKSGFTISKGKSYKLTAKVHPSNASNKDISWSSSKSSVASVKDGKVTAKKVGNASIEAKAKDGSGKKAYCNVAVIQIRVKSLDIKSSMHINKGSSKRIDYSISPTNATNKKLNWSSTDSTVASVSKTGKVTAHKSGTVTITARATDGSGIKDTCHVVVDDPKNDLKQRRSGH